LSEFNETKYSYTLANMSNNEFLPERLKRYRSPVILSHYLTSISDKFEAVLAIDVAMSIFHTFAES
jgi:hypothetical protein